MERLARICEKNNIRAVYQVHHRTLIPHSLSAWQIIKDLPHQWIGVMLDPGNQTFEGKENWAMAVSLLGKYLVSLGIKDVKYEWDEREKDSPSKGWKEVWVPAYEGVINWYDIKKVLSESQFEGTFVFMPFYHTEDPEIMTKKLREEVSYIRAIMKGE
jgi:sugar phosphate isomerase/epimerase